MELAEIERLIGSHFGATDYYDIDEDGYNWYDWKYETGDEPVEVAGLGTVTVVDEHGGEGQGDEYWVAFRVKFPDSTVRYFRMNGYYASYDGGYFDGPFVEVRPVEKLVTVYETL